MRIWLLCIWLLMKTRKSSMPLLFDLNREKASNIPVGMLNEFRLINGPKRFVVVLSFFLLFRVRLSTPWQPVVWIQITPRNSSVYLSSFIYFSPSVSMVTILSPLRLSLHTLGTSGLCFLSVSSICLFSTCVASLPHAQRRNNEQQAVFRVSPSRRVVGQRPRSLARRLQSRSAAKSSAARPVRFISFLFSFIFPFLA